jgi:hypothetical protein
VIGLVSDEGPEVDELASLFSLRRRVAAAAGPFVVATARSDERERRHEDGEAGEDAAIAMITHVVVLLGP